MRLFIILIVLSIVFISCKSELVIYETKFIKEQYLRINDLSDQEIYFIEISYINKGYEVNFYYEIDGTYMIITPEMFTAKHRRFFRQQYIIKRKYAEQLINMF